MTLIESMIAAGVLGIGVVGLVSSYGTADRGMVISRDRGAALELARQRLERFSTIPTNQLPACQPAATCRASLSSYATPLSAVGAFPCTQLVDGMGTAEPNTGATAGKFRIDTSLTAPADVGQQAGAQVVTVSVCWSEDGQAIQQLVLTRLLVPQV